MSGDYPVTGFQGRAKPVFDLDPVQTLDMIGSMNRGHEYPGPKGPIRLGPSDFFAGAAVSPFKATEAETLVQYFKLKKKIAAGRPSSSPTWLRRPEIPRVGQFMRQNGLDVPLVGNIFVLSFGVAKLMNQNRFPGCVVTDKLLADLDRERTAADKGEGSRLLRAARMYAVLKGMGFSRRSTTAGTTSVYDQGSRLSPRERPERELAGPAPPFRLSPAGRELLLLWPDAKTGLNTDEDGGAAGEGPSTCSGSISSNRLSRVCHGLLFEPRQGLYGAMRALSCPIKGPALEPPFAGIEHLAKVLLYDCLNCGDCGLPDTAYVCPMSRCPKNQRNGACGGSFNGWCEVHPGKRRCIYVMAYARLKHYGQEGKLDGRSIPPCNWDLYQSSSWINFYSGRDHTAGRLKIEEGIEKKRE
jgi:methylenetetrahydrofolate reductase (NADPH)